MLESHLSSSGNEHDSDISTEPMICLAPIREKVEKREEGTNPVYDQITWIIKKLPSDKIEYQV